MIMIGKNGLNTWMENKNNSDKVVLFDTSSNLQDLINLDLHDNYVIVTFDYESHNLLLNNKIKHTVSDSFLTQNDLESIEESAYSLAKWFNDPTIMDLISYKGVNLGQLFHVEFHYFLVPFLKKYVELTKILKAFNNSRYLCSPNLFEIVESFTKNSIKINEILNDKDQFLYDVIKYDMRIGKTFYSIKIPRVYYHKLKSFSEKIIHGFIGKKEYHVDYNTTLLVEFDTIRYQNILLELNKKPLNLILFNRRRPTVWNFKSFSIIKKSNCIVENGLSLMDESTNNSIQEGLLEMQQKVDSLWASQIFFESFFSMNNISFWPIIKSNFIRLAQKRFKEAIPEIEITQKLLEKYKFKLILVWSESGFNEQIIISLGKRLRVSIALLQHGLSYDTPELPPKYREIAGVGCIYVDKFIVWGKVTSLYAQKIGLPTNKIEVIGSPITDNLFGKSIKERKLTEGFILLATTSPVKNLVNDLTVKSMENYETAIKSVCKVAAKMKRKLVIKLHPFQDELDITKMVKEINPKVIVVKGGNIIQLIDSCDVMVVIDISTTILEAQILKKPVISISVKNYQWGNPPVFDSNSCVITDIDNFENSLNVIFNDNNFRKKIIENGTRFVNEYLSNQGTSSDKLLNFFQSYD